MKAFSFFCILLSTLLTLSCGKDHKDNKSHDVTQEVPLPEPKVSSDDLILNKSWSFTNRNGCINSVIFKEGKYSTEIKCIHPSLGLQWEIEYGLYKILNKKITFFPILSSCENQCQKKFSLDFFIPQGEIKVSLSAINSNLTFSRANDIKFSSKSNYYGCFSNSGSYEKNSLFTIDWDKEVKEEKCSTDENFMEKMLNLSKVGKSEPEATNSGGTSTGGSGQGTTTKQGCCSSHGGVCSNMCCDGTKLSAKCS